MTEPSMIERVARAMYAADEEIALDSPSVEYWFSGQNRETKFTADGYRTLARAAFAALREPTRAMVDAGDAALADQIDSDRDSRTDEVSSTIRSGAQTEVFRAMIDAALKEG